MVWTASLEQGPFRVRECQKVVAEGSQVGASVIIDGNTRNLCKYVMWCLEKCALTKPGGLGY